MGCGYLVYEEADICIIAIEKVIFQRKKHEKNLEFSKQQIELCDNILEVLNAKNKGDKD